MACGAGVLAYELCVTKPGRTTGFHVATNTGQIRSFKSDVARRGDRHCRIPCGRDHGFLTSESELHGNGGPDPAVSGHAVSAIGSSAADGVHQLPARTAGQARTA